MYSPNCLKSFTWGQWVRVMRVEGSSLLGLMSVSSVGLTAVVRGITVVVSVTKKALIVIRHVHTCGAGRAFAV